MKKFYAVLGKGLIYFLLAIISIFALFPVIYILLASFMQMP